MKTFLLKESIFPLILLLFCVCHLEGQDLNGRIHAVENGFSLPSIVPQDGTFPRKNIYQKLRDYKVNGASVAVIHNGKLDWSRTYGRLEATGKDSVMSTTLFQCASIGKIITALAALKLVEGGLVNLDESVNTKLRRWQIKENEYTQTVDVTLRHLLSHSAGLTDDYGFLGYKPTDNIPGLLQILNAESPSNAKKSLDIQTVPGTVERYSGAGYLIVQMLIEDVSGISFGAFVDRHIFQPIQMSHTTYEYRPDLNPAKSVASGHRANGKLLKNKKYNIYPEKAAAGPWTTAEDLAKLVLAIQDDSHPIISEPLRAEFLSPQINNKGLGVNLKGLDRPEAFWHAGQNLGYMGVLYGLIGRGDGAIMLINSDGGERIIQEFITSVAMVYDWPVMKSYHSIAIDENLLTNLTGTYENPDQGKGLAIERKGSELFVIPAGAKKGVQLYRIGENRFTFKDAQDYYRLSFNFESEQVSSLNYMESIGRAIELEKVK